MKPIKEITALCLFFMLMIFIHHNWFCYGGGGCATAGFFLISGFCMMLGYGDKVLKGNFSWKQYMLRRCIKLYPLHWIGLLLSWVFAKSCYFHLGPKFFAGIGLNALLLQSWVPDKSFYFSYNSPSWYLCDILFFAAIFPLLIKLAQKMPKLIRNILPVVLVLVYIAIAQFLTPDQRHAWLYIHPLSRMIDCILGMYLAALFMKMTQSDFIINQVKKNILIIDLCIAVLFALVVAQSIGKWSLTVVYMSVYWPTEMALLLLIALRSQIEKHTFIEHLLNNKVVTYLGTCSLSFYLLHVPVLNAVHCIVPIWGCNAQNIVGCLVCMVVTFVIARISYNLIEKKLTGWLNRKLIKQTT